MPKHQQKEDKMPKAILRDPAICNRAFKLNVLGSIPKRAEHNAVQMVSRRLEESAGPSAEETALWRLVIGLFAPLVAEQSAPQSWHNVIHFLASPSFSMKVVLLQQETGAERRSGYRVGLITQTSVGLTPFGPGVNA